MNSCVPVLHHHPSSRFQFCQIPFRRDPGTDQYFSCTYFFTRCHNECYYHIAVTTQAWPLLSSISPTVPGYIAHRWCRVPPGGCVSRCTRTVWAGCSRSGRGRGARCLRSPERLLVLRRGGLCRPVEEWFIFVYVGEVWHCNRSGIYFRAERELIMDAKMQMRILYQHTSGEIINNN